MQLEWVNHARFIVHTRSLHLMTDPWIEGPAFNNGWALLSPTQFRYSDFDRITHIWISREHPDHFSPPNLKQIPGQFRSRIKVLFHSTRDKRVVNVCRALGFLTEELTPRKWVDLGDGAAIICGPEGLMDSWMAIKDGATLLLNVNDCVFARRSIDRIGDLLRPAGPIDVLLTQFSYANWVGNPGDRASHRFHAEQKCAQMRQQLELFHPRTLIPFASFIVFSHSENHWMNEGTNRIADIYRFAVEDLAVPTQVLYPGDTWTVAEPRSSDEAISKYQRDLAQKLTANPDRSPSVPIEQLQEISNKFVRQANLRNNRLLLAAIPPCIVRLSDLAMNVELSFRKGVTISSDGSPDIITSSDSLAYCMLYEWGGDTLAINGRYEVPAGGNADRFFRIFRVPAHNSAGNSVTFGFALRQLAKRMGLDN